MLSYNVYHMAHLVGLFMVLIPIGAAAAHILQGGTRENFVARKKMGALHGIGWLIVFIAGFGLMARAQFSFAGNNWLWMKLFILALLGVYPSFIYRMPKRTYTLLLLLFALLFAALYLVNYKPF